MPPLIFESKKNSESMKRLMMIGSKTGDLRLYCKQSQTLRIEIKILRIEIKILNFRDQNKNFSKLGCTIYFSPKKKKKKNTKPPPLFW